MIEYTGKAPGQRPFILDHSIESKAEGPHICRDVRVQYCLLSLFIHIKHQKYTVCVMGVHAMASEFENKTFWMQRPPVRPAQHP
jgi:hypothetical protein